MSVMSKETKTCNKCNINKIITDFHFRHESKKYRNECKKCFNIGNKNRQDKYKNENKNINLKDKKKCIECKKNKNLSNFVKSNSTKSGVIGLCKQCHCSRMAIERDRIRKLNATNDPASSKKCSKCKLIFSKSNFRLCSVSYDGLYHLCKMCSRKEDKIRWENVSVERRISIILRSRLRMALKNNYKTGSAVQDLGCSINELMKYLESKFQDGMTWENYGQFGWHIDHIMPLSKFDLTKQSQIKKACHYTNLQPLWWKDNLVKGDR